MQPTWRKPLWPFYSHPFLKSIVLSLKHRHPSTRSHSKVCLFNCLDGYFIHGLRLCFCWVLYRQFKFDGVVLSHSEVEQPVMIIFIVAYLLSCLLYKMSDNSEKTPRWWPQLSTCSQPSSVSCHRGKKPEHIHMKEAWIDLEINHLDWLVDHLKVNTLSLQLHCKSSRGYGLKNVCFQFVSRCCRGKNTFSVSTTDSQEDIWSRWWRDVLRTGDSDITCSFTLALPALWCLILLFMGL